MYWGVSLAPPDLGVLSLLNEIYPNQRPIRGAVDNVCRFFVMDGLLKRVVTLLHVCSCSAYCANCTWCFMTVCVRPHSELLINSQNYCCLLCFLSNNDICHWQDEADLVELRMCISAHVSGYTVPVAGVESFVSCSASLHSMPLLTLEEYWKRWQGVEHWEHLKHSVISLLLDLRKNLFHTSVASVWLMCL